jgi:hypothetical protein
MAAVASPVPEDHRLEASDGGAPAEARERRDTDRAIGYWEQEARRLGHAPTLMTLDAAEITSDKWGYRFIVSVDPVVENCVLLFYGDKFAALLGLPTRPNHNIPMVHQLPKRFVPLFTRGCTDAISSRAAVRMEGAIERKDGRRELYRAVFVGFRVKPDGLTHLTFGTFNYRVSD